MVNNIVSHLRVNNMKSFSLLQSYLEYSTETSFIDGDNHTRVFQYLKKMLR